MTSNAARSKLFFKTISSLGGFAEAYELPSSHDVRPYFAVGAVASVSGSEQRLTRIGWRLAALARQARLDRRMDVLKDVSATILELPLPDEIKCAGLYYQAVVEKQFGNVGHAWGTFARIASGPSRLFRGRAILELGKTLFDAGQPVAALPLYVEAVRAAQETDLPTATTAQMMIAVVRSMDGDHGGALSDLDRLWPMVRIASHEHPALPYDYLNSLAVEMAETGRIQEAKHAIAIALRSPFAGRYPNWKTTRDEIDDKERRTSYRSRIFSLAGLLLMSAATVPQTTLPELPPADTGLAGHADVALAVESPSANTAGPATESRTDTPPPAAPPIDPAGQSARRSPLTISSCFINGEIAPAAISRPITNFQTALAPSSGYPHRNPHFSGKRGRTFQIAWARSRATSQVSAPSCQARRDSPDDIRAAAGYPESPLARGPPPTSIKL
jgi:hypothetical protein